MDLFLRVYACFIAGCGFLALLFAMEFLLEKFDHWR